MMDYRVFLMKWCQICLKLNLNLFKFEPIFPKFLKFRIYRRGPIFFLPVKKTWAVQLGLLKYRACDVALQVEYPF